MYTDATIIYGSMAAFEPATPFDPYKPVWVAANPEHDPITDGEGRRLAIEGAVDALASKFEGHTGYNEPVYYVWLGVSLCDLGEYSCALGGEIVATDDQKQEAQAKYDALPENAKSLFSEPGYYIVWGKS